MLYLQVVIHAQQIKIIAMQMPLHIGMTIDLHGSYCRVIHVRIYSEITLQHRLLPINSSFFHNTYIIEPTPYASTQFCTVITCPLFQEICFTVF